MGSSSTVSVGRVEEMEQEGCSPRISPASISDFGGDAAKSIVLSPMIVYASGKEVTKN